MEFKLFGKSLFEIKSSKAQMFLGPAMSGMQESKFLPDFYKGFEGSNPISIASFTSATMEVLPPGSKKETENQNVKRSTPKEIHELKLLHDRTFKLRVDEGYVDGQLSTFKDKLALIKSEEYDMARGVKEIGSIVVRLENRKKYPDVREFFEQFPYTTTGRIEDLVKEHDHLKIGQVAEFLADMPKEATDVMKDYNKNTDKVCGKQAVFYIIAEKKDFERTTKRRDPILLAQSPFGHFWQILGAWDKEMILVEEL